MIKLEVTGTAVVSSDASRSYAGTCMTCHHALPRLANAAAIYFDSGVVICENCKREVDLWAAAITHSCSWMPLSLGATCTSFLKEIESGQLHRIDLSDCGVPPDARILTTNYTSQGGPDGAVTAIEFHANLAHQRYIGNILRLIGFPLGDGKLPRSGIVAIAVVWIHKDDSEAWPYLVSAIESVATQDYSPAMVFAQSAVEISLMPLIAKRFERVASRQRIKELMTGDLGYSHALNVVLPYMCEELGIRQLPDQIRGSLTSLNTLRNSIVHKGVKSDSISEKEAMRGMTAAAFGFEYVRYITPRFLKE
jgi:hypothetical protein